MLKQVEHMGSELKQNGFINSVYEESPYGILVFDYTLEVLDWNPAVEKLIGLTKEACIGHKLLEVFPSIEERKQVGAGMEVKGTMVVSETLARYFSSGVLKGMKISVIVDKSGSINGGTLILTPHPNNS